MEDVLVIFFLSFPCHHVIASRRGRGRGWQSAVFGVLGGAYTSTTPCPFSFPFQKKKACRLLNTLVLRAISISIATTKIDDAVAITNSTATVAGPSPGLFSPDLFILTTYYFEPAISVYGQFTFFVRSAWKKQGGRGGMGRRGRDETEERRRLKSLRIAQELGKIDMVDIQGPLAFFFFLAGLSLLPFLFPFFFFSPLLFYPYVVYSGGRGKGRGG